MSKKMTDGALVGRFERKLDATRRVRIPSEWFVLMGEPKSVVVMAHPEERCLVLLSEAMYKAHARQLKDEVEHLNVNARHCIRISDKLLRFAFIKEQVVFLGSIRYAKLVCKSGAESAEVG